MRSALAAVALVALALVCLAPEPAAGEMAGAWLISEVRPWAVEEPLEDRLRRDKGELASGVRVMSGDDDDDGDDDDSGDDDSGGGCSLPHCIEDALTTPLAVLG